MRKPVASRTDIAAAPGAADQSGVVPARALHVVEFLREQIIRGKLKPGDRIVERRLSAELNVSRTPIREALKLLEMDGLIQISTNRGAQVSAYSANEARELFDVIAVLEGLAAQRLAETTEPRIRARLEGIHAEMVCFFQFRDLDNYFDANSTIHDLIVRESGNRKLVESHGRLMLKARRGRFLAIMSDDRWAQSVDEHEALMTAIRAGDGAAAFTVWRTHLEHTGATVAAVLEQNEENERMTVPIPSAPA